MIRSCVRNNALNRDDLEDLDKPDRSPDHAYGHCRGDQQGPGGYSAAAGARLRRKPGTARQAFTFGRASRADHLGCGVAPPYARDHELPARTDRSAVAVRRIRASGIELVAPES